MGNILAIVGRPNVGKSTLFNRLTETRDAIVDAESGVTRDRNYGKCDWNGLEFSVIDTGGYVNDSDDVFEEEIKKQVKFAIEEASLILFMVDVREGVNPMDEDVAKILRSSKKEVILAVNKVDSSALNNDIHEFYRLGFDMIFPMASNSGSGTGDILDEVVKRFEKFPADEELDLPRFTIVGRPNVGKSSLINALLEVDRHIVTPVAGTTRDAIFTRYNKYGLDFFLVDTAGLRKKAKVNEDIEFYSVMRSIRAIEGSDVCILMLDATLGFESQDMNIFSLIQKNHKGIVVVVNKWDLIEKSSNSSRDFEAEIKRKTAPFTNFPVIFTSVIEKQRILKVLQEAQDVYDRFQTRVTTSKLNEEMLPIIENNPPPAIKGKYVKIKYVTQLHTKFPSFAFFCNLPQYIKDPYKRFIENKFREKFNFSGVPMEIYFRSK